MSFLSISKLSPLIANQLIKSFTPEVISDVIDYVIKIPPEDADKQTGYKYFLLKKFKF